MPDESKQERLARIADAIATLAGEDSAEIAEAIRTRFDPNGVAALVEVAVAGLLGVEKRRPGEPRRVEALAYDTRDWSPAMRIRYNDDDDVLRVARLSATNHLIIAKLLQRVADQVEVARLADMETLQRLGVTIEVHELVRVDWPSPDGTIYYGTTQTLSLIHI